MAALTLEGITWEGLVALFLVLVFFTCIALLVDKEINRYTATKFKKKERGLKL